MDSLRRYAPATERNREPLFEALRTTLPEAAPGGSLLLEVASGTGEHAAHLAPRLPGWSWLPTDPSGDARASVDAWSAHVGAANVQPAVGLDATGSWSDVHAAVAELGLPVDALLCVNLIHISPFAVTEGLMQGAGSMLSERGVLLTYGPYRVDGEHTSESNIRFEAWLKSMDERFGVRDVADVSAAAAAHGLCLRRRIAMPANNFVLVFDRASANGDEGRVDR